MLINNDIIYLENIIINMFMCVFVIDNCNIIALFTCTFSKTCVNCTITT